MEQLHFDQLEWSGLAWSGLDFSGKGNDPFPEVGKSTPVIVDTAIREWVDMPSESPGQIILTTPAMRAGDLIGKPLECVVIVGRDGTMTSTTPNSFVYIVLKRASGTSGTAILAVPTIQSINYGAQFVVWMTFSSANTVNSGVSTIWMRDSYNWAAYTNSIATNISYITNGNLDTEVALSVCLSDARTEAGKTMRTHGIGVYKYESV